MAEKNCPECANHCPADNLKCGRGARYFGIRQEEKEPQASSNEDHVIILLRRCGHHLHHNVGHGSNSASLENVLTPEEKSTLESLLQKCLEHWQNQK